MGPVPVAVAWPAAPAGAAYGAAKQRTGRKYTTPDAPAVATGFAPACVLPPAAGPRSSSTAETINAASTTATMRTAAPRRR